MNHRSHSLIKNIVLTRIALGLPEKVGCGTCAHAPYGWRSGCQRDKTKWRKCAIGWPEYSTVENYPGWEPHDEPFPEGWNH